MASRELHEIETMLDHCVKGIGKTIRNLTNLADTGLPATTPGNGDPGGGKGGGRTIVIDGERYPTTGVEVAVLEPRHDICADTLIRLSHEITVCTVRATDTHTKWWGKQPTPLPANAGPVQSVMYAYRIARLLVAADADLRPAAWHRTAHNLHGIVSTWGFDYAIPEGAREREQLALDNTSTWCRSCLRVGWRVYRDKLHPASEMCQWCRKFTMAEGFHPPATLLELRNEGRTILEAMVAPYRKAHRDRKKTKTRRKGKR